MNFFTRIRNRHQSQRTLVAARIRASLAGRWDGLDLLESRVLLSAIDLTLSNSTPILTNNPALLISGTESDNAAPVEVTITHTGGAAVGTFDAITDGNGNWSLALPGGANLPDGQYDLSITASDNGGADTGTLTLGASLTIDTTAHVSINSLTTNNTTPTITGTLDADVNSITVTVGGTDFTSGDGDVVISGTTWSLALPTQSEGVIATSVTGTDAAGNIATPAAGSLTVDSTAPSVTIDDGQLPLTTAGNTTLTGTYTDSNIDTVTVTLDDGHGHVANFDADLNAGVWSATIPALGLVNATYGVSITATDLATNSTTITPGDLTFNGINLTLTNSTPIDTNDPTLGLSGTSSDPTANVSLTITHTGGSAVGTYQAQTDGNGTWTVALPGGVALADGQYDLLVSATDNGGADNGSLSLPAALTVNTTANVSINSLITSNTTPTITGTLDADVTAITVTVGNNTYTSGGGDVVISGTSWSLALPLQTDGFIALTATGTDALGNVAPMRGALLIVDTIPPTVAINNGQLPLTTNGNTTLTGTYSDINIDTVTVNLDDGLGHTANFDATTNSGNWSAPLSSADLVDGTYTVRVTALDFANNTTTITAGTLTLDTVAPVVSTDTVVTSDTTPALSGTVDDPTANVVITIHGVNYNATNNGNGTWALTDNTITALPNGIYQINVAATDPAGNIGTFNNAYLVVNGTTPTVTVNKLFTTNTSPALSGTVSDPAASIVVNVNGNNYNAVNNGDGTWSLAASTITALPVGTYNVGITATNALGIPGNDATTNELTVGATQTVTLGGAITKLTYVDADGTTVTISSGKGQVQLTLAGVDAIIFGSGKSRTATATGGIRQLDINVQAATASLSISASAAGDGLATINTISGAGILKTLSAKNINLIGGINMTGYIQSITLHSILSDITMGTYAKGASIVADTFANATLNVGVIKTLTAKQSYQNTSVTSTLITTASLANVQTDNGGTPFGITAITLKSLTLHQAGNSLKWNKNFTDSILDFDVNT